MYKHIIRISAVLKALETANQKLNNSHLIFPNKLDFDFCYNLGILITNSTSIKNFVISKEIVVKAKDLVEYCYLNFLALASFQFLPYSTLNEAFRSIHYEDIKIITSESFLSINKGSIEYIRRVMLAHHARYDEKRIAHGSLSKSLEKITQCVLNALFDFVQNGLNDKHHHTPLFVKFFLI